jgi:hypothetical protein
VRTSACWQSIRLLGAVCAPLAGPWIALLGSEGSHDLTASAPRTSPATLIDRFMPAPALRQVDCVAVATTPKRAWEVARTMDMYRIPLARALFQLRTLPERLLAGRRDRPRRPAPTARIDDIAGAASGFQILAEETGREVVIGAIGKVWKPSIEFVRVPPAEYAAFDQPGFVKVTWCVRVDARRGGGSWITVDVRVSATDRASLAKFQRYWTLIGPFSHWIRRSLLRLLSRELGTVDEERPG